MDKRYNSFSAFVVCIIFSLAFPMHAYADSSWHWISDTRPYDVLPYVIVMTLAIETFSIVLLGKPCTLCVLVLVWIPGRWNIPNIL